MPKRAKSSVTIASVAADDDNLQPDYDDHIDVTAETRAQREQLHNNIRTATRYAKRQNGMEAAFGNSAASFASLLDGGRVAGDAASNGLVVFQQNNLFGGGSDDDEHSLRQMHRDGDGENENDEEFPERPLDVPLAPGEVLEQGIVAAAAPPPPPPAGRAPPPVKNYCRPPTRDAIALHFGTPGADDRCFICERLADGELGVPAAGVQRMMEVFDAMEGQSYKSTIQQVEELRKAFRLVVKAEIDKAAQTAYDRRMVSEVRLCPDWHPMLIWEHFYDTHDTGNRLGDPLRVLRQRLGESADVIYKDQYYYNAITPEGRSVTMVDKDAWRMVREHAAVLLQLEAHRGLAAAAASSSSSSSAIAGGKMAATASAPGSVSQRAVKLFGNAALPGAAFGRPSELKLFSAATGAGGAAARTSKRGDEKT
jgi:hypothetical protein